MSGRYATQGAEAEAQPGSRGRVLANRLGIVRVRDMQIAETAALLQLTNDLPGEVTEDQQFTATICAPGMPAGWATSTTGRGATATST